MASTAAQIAFENGWCVHAPHSESNKQQFEAMPDTSWGALPRRIARELDSVMVVKNHDPGDILFVEGETIKRVFVLVSGDVRLSMQDPCGRRLTFQVARPGAILGMESVLYQTACDWSADALHSCRVGVVAQEEFVRFAKRNPEVYRIATTQLMETVRAACSALRIIGLNPCIRKRLAFQLLEWGERGKMEGDQAQFRMALTHEQLAECVGAARESITRALITFKQLGLVEVRGSIIRIPSTTALSKYAEAV